MAGHSKWANIQHRKGAQDKKRATIFTKLIREITVAARMGGDDSSANARLRLAIDKAYGQNMPKDTIERAIKRGAGSAEGDNVIEVRYEGYGPGGVAVMVDCLTDNRNRTVGEVRHAFAKGGGNLGTDGSVSYLFNKCGLLSFSSDSQEEHIMEVALEAGALDINADNSGIEVITAPEKLEEIKVAMCNAKLVPERVEITMLATTQVTLDADNAEKMLRLLETLEDLDDVQQVYSNADIPEDILQKL